MLRFFSKPTRPTRKSAIGGSLNPRILFADDDPDTRELVKLMLSSEGFEVVDVGDPEVALNLAKALQFDAFLLDYWMPHLSGIDLCQRIRRFDRHTPIVFYSGAAYKGDRTAALLAGRKVTSQNSPPKKI